MVRFRSGRRAALGVALLVGAVGALGASVSASVGSARASALSTCFWYGPYTTARGGVYNTAFPDSGATYWSVRMQLPAGARLILHGRFPHARYESLNSYNSTASPTDNLHDVSVHPDPGSSNPFRIGASRTVARRSYTEFVLNSAPPANRSAGQENTLYAGVSGQTEQRLLYRVYVPDRGRDLTGGVGLPSVELRLANGQVLHAGAACSALKLTRSTLPLTLLPKALYESLRDQPGKPPTFPASKHPVFGAFYNISFTIGCIYHGMCGGLPARTGGQYSNIDNNYVAANVSRGFGKVLVLRGKLPTTPQTRDGQHRMGVGQLRYWSLCQNESLFTTRGAGCLYDAEVPVDRHGYYTIVTSLPRDRPVNATARCGVGFIPWPARGDGDGHLNDGLLLLRNMLPAGSFKHAVQDTKLPGDERRVMGAYLPAGTYTSPLKFKRRGCLAAH